MGLLRNPLPVILFSGMISSDRQLFEECTHILEAEYGSVDSASGPMPWETTAYYRDEMGPNLYRKFIFFRELIDPGELASVKIFTNSIEDRFTLHGTNGSRRRINIDPGYLTESKVVLASTKDFAHRIYIGNGIYAEVTLRYSSRERSFLACDHTYFDFRTEDYRMIFNAARNVLRKTLKEQRWE